MTDLIHLSLIHEDMNPDKITECGLKTEGKPDAEQRGDDGSWPVCRACHAASMARQAERIQQAKEWADDMLARYQKLAEEAKKYEEYAVDQITRLGGPIQ